jgi:manganese transport protein
LITRLVAIIPAFFVILFTGEENVDELLVLSQVILSMQLAFAVIPLIHFVSNKSTMGKFTIKPLTRTFAWLIATILVYLNIRMLIEEFTPVFQAPELWPKILIIFVGVVFTYLLVFIIIQPFWMKNKLKATQPIHSPANVLSEFSIPAYKKIAIALDFTKYDQKLIESAVGQGKEDTSYLLIHVVESASARLLGNETADFEAVNDKRQLNSYIEQLTGMGLQVEGALGYKNRASEIVRLVKQYGADLLVIGAHGHTGFKDFVYGQTVNTVRHELKVPVLVVNL